MSNETNIICFTDLKDSTRFIDKHGHDTAVPEILDHLKTAEIFTTFLDGEYIKNIGDANFPLFKDPIGGIRFATLLQEYCKTQPCLKRSQMGIKIGLFQGIVDRVGDDAFGYAANAGARIQGLAESGTVLINEDLYESLKKVWGATKADSFVSFEKEDILKGLSESEKMFSFDWQKFSKSHPEMSLAQMVYDHLNTASVELSNLSVSDLANPGMIIWPVVPRDLVTAIHRGQAEIIRLLALLGWKLKLLVADCGTKNYERGYSERFRGILEKYMASRNVSPIETIYMSDMYEPTFEFHAQVLDVFRRVAADINLEDLLGINQKTYEKKIQEKIKLSPTLDLLRPTLSMAAVVCLAKHTGQKSIVVSGADERIQWQRAYRIPPQTREYVGVLMNPILLMDEKHQGKHKSDWPIWDSRPQLIREMYETNLAWWTFRLHAFLPAFPSPFVEINKQNISPEEWNDEMTIPENLSREDLADYVWQCLAP